MKNCFKVLSMLSILFFSSCAKEPTTLPAKDTATASFSIDDPTGLGVSDRSADDYKMGMWNNSGVYGFQVKFYENGTLTYSSSTTWVYGSYSSGSPLNISNMGDNGNNNSYTVTFYRKVPSVPVTISINWSSNCNGTSSTETFTIGTSGTARSHAFNSCF